MATALGPTRQTLADLAGTDSYEVAILFFQQKERFLSELGRSLTDGTLPALRDTWSRSTDAILTRIQKNWVDVSAPGLWQAAAVEMQRLRSFVSIRLTATHP